jgi:CheY-like chemotaxis protein
LSVAYSVCRTFAEENHRDEFADREGRLPVLAVPSDPSIPTNPKSRVLVVDDDARLAVMMANWLQNDNYDVTTTTSPTEAIALAGQRTFDLAIVDISFPAMSGWDLIAHLKQLQPSLKVIIWTGWDQAMLGSSPLRELVDGLLPKPSRLADLRKILAECLPRP